MDSYTNAMQETLEGTNIDGTTPNDEDRIMETEETHACEDCIHLRNNHCKLWKVAVSAPHDSSCESLTTANSPYGRTWRRKH